ncbi:MAG: TetR family transcriptional regulator [Myxococcota bacterium]|nr:TetR family transcriptional regulator [Myxococcota bacterium]
MPERAVRPHYQRARSEAEKAERREAILAAASLLLRASGFEGFSMSVLARKSGIAKGTLYLYFETREEVLLALYVETLAAWSRALVAGLRDGMSDDAFVALFQTTAAADPNFSTLRARLESVIEHNVSLERLVEAKRAMRSLLADLAPRVERALGLAPGTAARLLVALGALHLGAAQSNAGPAWAGLDLPDDVAEFMRLHTETDVFRETAPLIVAGMRAS